MKLEDKAFGVLLSSISLSVFIYYTFWVIVLPFVDEDHFIHKYFLPPEFAILIPAFVFVMILSLLCVFIGAGQYLINEIVDPCSCFSTFGRFAQCYNWWSFRAFLPSLIDQVKESKQTKPSISRKLQLQAPLVVDMMLWTSRIVLR